MSSQDTINIDGLDYVIGAFPAEAQQAIYHVTAIKAKLNELEATKQHYTMAYDGFAKVIAENLPEPIANETNTATFKEAEAQMDAKLGGA